MAYTTVNDPSAYFHTQLYTGDGQASKTVTNDANAGNFKPDWIWVKNRDDTDSHMISDSSRGSTNAITSNSDGAEFTPTNGNLAFLTDGFSFGSNNNYNRSSDKFVAWQWKANGGTTASNSDGSITSTVQANTTAGFSIVTYTGNGSSGATIGHGLGAVPDTIIIKARSDTQNWFVNTPVGGGVGYLMLNQTNGDSGANSSVWNSTTPTSTVFTLGNSGGINGNTQTYVAYCFKSIKGYSKIGTYTGNAAEPAGPFIYTGFAPAFIMVKASSEAGQNWVMGDRARDPYNIAIRKLFANTSGSSSAAVGDNNWDFLSNGFQIRTSDDAMNKSGVTFRYLAFAEMPLVATNNVIALAR